MDRQYESIHNRRYNQHNISIEVTSEVVFSKVINRGNEYIITDHVMHNHILFQIYIHLMKFYRTPPHWVGSLCLSIR